MRYDICYNRDESQKPMLSEISQTQRITYCMTPLYEISRIEKEISIEKENGSVLPGADDRAEGQMTA